MNPQSQDQFFVQNQNRFTQLRNLESEQLNLAIRLADISREQQSIQQYLDQQRSQIQQTQQTQIQQNQNQNQNQTQQLCFQPNNNQVVCLSVQPLNANNGQNPLSTQGAGGAALGGVLGNLGGSIAGGLAGNQSAGGQIGQSIGTALGALLPF